MIYLLVFLIFPICCGLFVKFVLHQTYNWKEFALNIGIVTVMVGIVLALGTVHATRDHEVWNGKIVSKHRDHGHYVRSYDCNCYETCTGSGTDRRCSTTCQTCYEDRYTVDWYAKSTVGTIRFKSLDRSSRRVYDTPDPASYRNCVEGEPASQMHAYTNYVQAAANSLFNTNLDGQVYQDKVPNYPTVRSYYKINRVLNVDSDIPASAIRELNDLLNEELITLGSLKQVNFVVILTGISDPYFRHTVENTWLGGKKNDVVVFIGLNGDTITWVDVMTWALNSGNELFRVTLRDKLAQHTTFDPTTVATHMVDVTKQLYDRPQMKDYEYLKGDIKPSFTILIICWIISILGTLILTFIFHRTDL